MFNMMGEDPPIVMISVNRLRNGSLKDTSANILRTGEFVVHLADEAIAEQMHGCGERSPPGESELAKAGLTPVPSRMVFLHSHSGSVLDGGECGVVGYGD